MPNTLTKTAAKRRKKLMDLGMQVQAQHMRGDDEAAHSAENKLKTAALQELSKVRAPAMATQQELYDLIAEVRVAAKLGLATVGLKFPRRTA
jgi:hypothetical protein